MHHNMYVFNKSKRYVFKHSKSIINWKKNNMKPKICSKTPQDWNPRTRAQTHTTMGHNINHAKNHVQCCKRKLAKKTQARTTPSHNKQSCTNKVWTLHNKSKFAHGLSLHFFNDTNKWPPVTGNKPSAVTHMALHLPQMRSSGFTILISSEHKQLHASTVPMAQCMMGGTKAPSPQ